MASPGIIIEFIGGEPFLCVWILLIRFANVFLYDKANELMHPWATKFCISICSNGVLYEPKVQKFPNKWRHNLFSITIDGNKALHDACRVFQMVLGSYDVAVAGARD